MPPDTALRSGMFARVSIPIGKAGLILIPLTAVIHSGQLTGIYIVDDTQTAKFRLIRTGKTYGEFIEILSGLKQEDRYVSVPPPTLINGMKVEIDS
jgi:multidrug efflux pump subunit AcrA (membrane-fusion protein)